MKPFVLIAFPVLMFVASYGQRKKQPENTPAVTAPTGIEAAVAGMKKYPGFIEFYFDEKKDRIFLLIEHPGTELLYIEPLTAGVAPTTSASIAISSAASGWSPLPPPTTIAGAANWRYCQRTDVRLLSDGLLRRSRAPQRRLRRPMLACRMPGVWVA